MKKIKIFLFCVLFVGTLFLFQEVKAITGSNNAEELKALILSLQLQIEQLQKQLNQIEKPGSAPWCHNFNTNLKYGDKGSEVEALQLVLEKEGFKITDSEKNPSANFGEFTASAVVGFQEKYNKEILAPLGLERGTGFFGKATRQKLNKIYGCAASSIFLNPILPVSTSSLMNTQLPDLTVTDIRFAEKPFSWSSDNFIFAKVCNYSSQNLQIENPEVGLEVDGIYAGLFNGSKSLLGAGKCVEAHFSTFYPLAIQTGSHLVVATADPSNKIPESNENNNKLAKQIFIISVDSLVSMPQQSGYDKCSFGGGFSLPESSANKCGWPVGSLGYVKDCCCCYLNTHVHDLGGTFSNKQVLIEYMPGLYQGCSSPMTVYSSLDGVSWNTVLTTNVKQETWTPKTTYNKTINVSGQFRYIKIYIPSCYNDYSSAKVLGDILGTPSPSITILFPNGGEILESGKTYDITWNSTGLNGKYIDLRLNLTNQNFSAGLDIKHDVLVDTGKYSWTVPYILENFNLGISGNQYKIEVITHKGDPFVYELSDNYFSIVSLAGDSSITSFNYTESDAYNGSVKFYWTNNTADKLELKMSCHSGLSITNAANGAVFPCGENSIEFSPNSNVYLKFNNNSGFSINAVAVLTPITGGIKNSSYAKNINLTISYSGGAMKLIENQLADISFKINELIKIIMSLK